MNFAEVQRGRVPPKHVAGLPCTIVDVFGVDVVSGNPLAVVHAADALPDRAMQEIARYMNLSETVFLHRPTTADADYAVRIFALDRELPFAGHPTLGACHAWLEAGGQSHVPSHIVQQCGAGLISVIDDGSLGFVAPPLGRHERPTSPELGEALELLGSEGDGLIEAMWVDNGPGWLALLFDSAERILTLKPKRSWPDHLHLGMAGFQPAGGDYAIETRAFHTDQHMNCVEDPVTGSFNAALALWLVGEGRLPPCYSVSQGQCVGRRGRIEICSRHGEIIVSGSTRTVVRGTALLG